jgi:predicted Rossmann-fold nucleotide-binding protein
MGDVERPYAVLPERLYTRDDLMQGWHPGADHSVTLDGRIYAYVKAHGGRAPDMVEGLAQRTHDFYIDSALVDFLMENARPVIGIMGGSDTMASDRNYRRVVEVAASLTQRGYLVVGGGGLGIMEAANLGAYLADRSDAERDDAVRALAETPGYAADQAGYLQVAVEILERFAPGCESLAIPTWVSEGEPISQFASHIAKYFSNSIREDGLLAVATTGIVFAPGGAGTMQEIFQDAAQNAYTGADRLPCRLARLVQPDRRRVGERGVADGERALRPERRLGERVGREPERVQHHRGGGRGSRAGAARRPPAVRRGRGPHDRDVRDPAVPALAIRDAI